MTDIMLNAPENLLEHRIAKDRELFFVDLSPAIECGEYAIRKRKKLFGIYQGDTEIFPPVFDEVLFLGDDIFQLRVSESLALFNALSREMTKFKYSYIEKAADKFAEVTDIGSCLRGIFCVDEWREVISPYYDEIGCFCNSERVWCRKGIDYDYVSLRDGQILNVRPLTMAYDNVDYMLGITDLGLVVALDSEGRISGELLRKLVMRNGGHLYLQNYKKKIEHIIDVYGNILNI